MAFKKSKDVTPVFHEEIYQVPKGWIPGRGYSLRTLCDKSLPGGSVILLTNDKTKLSCCIEFVAGIELNENWKSWTETPKKEEDPQLELNLGGGDTKPSTTGESGVYPA